MLVSVCEEEEEKGEQLGAACQQGGRVLFC